MQRILRGHNGKNTSRIAEHIKKQLKEDEMDEQLTMSVYGPLGAVRNNLCACGLKYAGWP